MKLEFLWLISSIFVTLVSNLGIVHGSDTEFHFVRLERMNETEDLFKYDLKKVEKVNDTAFQVNCDSELFVTLDNEWHMWIQVYHNQDGSENFPDKPVFQVPKKGFCDFMNSTYKHSMFDSLRQHSNLPEPEDCPVSPKQFQIKDWVLNVGRFSAMAKAGMYRVDMFVSQDHEESHITKVGVRMFTEVRKKE